MAVPKTVRRRPWSLSNLEPSLFLGPAMLVYLIFFVVPVLFSLFLSFVDWDMISPTWNVIGFDNYISVIKDPVFRKSLRNTILYVLGTVPVSVALGLGVALLVESVSWGKQAYRFIFFTPVVTSIAVVGVVWALMFTMSHGLINQILASVGIIGPNWLNEPGAALVAIMIVGVWKSFGYNMVLFIPGLKGIDKQLYEAAQIDGAGRWAQFWHVTWPMLSPVTFFVVTMSVIQSFQVFVSVQVMTKGGPNNATNVMVYHIYEEAFRFFDAGRASASATILFVLIALITIMQIRLSQRTVHYR